MLTTTILEGILNAIPKLRIGVLGDLFLDRYLDLDADLTERSLETSLDAYQVVRVRSQPGAAGTIINNLVAFGVQSVHPISVIGDDGEGYELRQALDRLEPVDSADILVVGGRRTPTYAKPMLHQAGRAPRELNRMDIKNRSPLDDMAELFVVSALESLWSRIDALLVLDQVGEYGVVTDRVIDRLRDLGQSSPNKLILADSRNRIDRFRGVSIKPNSAECLAAEPDVGSAHAAAMVLARRSQRAVFCTAGERGIWVADPGEAHPVLVPAYRVDGPIDIVGAGDSTSAAIACAIATGSSLHAAAAFGNLVASITIQQFGTTGTASLTQIRERWRAMN